MSRGRDLDVAGLTDRYAALHRLSPEDPKREYWRGRIDEYLSQNALAENDADVVYARSQAGVIVGREREELLRLVPPSSAALAADIVRARKADGTWTGEL